MSARRRVLSSTARWFAEWRRMTPPGGMRMGSFGGVVDSEDRSERMASPTVSPMVSQGMETLESMG